MLKKSFLLFLLMSFAFISQTKADMFSVQDIHIDVTAQNATLAREQGLNEAQEKAFYKMLDRLTLFQDTEALPVLTNEDILNLVQDFSISNEKTSSVRYIADVDVQFNPQAIQTFFQEYQVPYVTYSAPTSVVFPVYKETADKQPLLWQDTNLWMGILENASKKSDLVPLVVPFGDLDDIAVVNENNLSDLSSIDILPILQRYQAQNAFIIELSHLNDNSAVKVLIKALPNQKSFIEEIGLTEPINAPLPDVLKRAAERAVYLLEQKWREKNAVRFDNPTRIFVKIEIDNLSQWLTYRKRLDKIKLIKQYVVKSVRRDLAEIEVFYVGQLEAFQNALKEDGLFLSKTNEENHFLLQELKDIPQEEILENNMPDLSEDTQTEIVSEETTTLAENPYVLPEEIRTFSLELYQQAEMNAETLDMLSEMKKIQPPIQEE
ncbi:MAG: DUF2066 domain-containing protein [Alphaproteobacteria bacterium]|nr:DUF2066 domain-containing protein [Alphaproteobacteria bacterium]